MYKIRVVIPCFNSLDILKKSILSFHIDDLFILVFDDNISFKLIWRENSIFFIEKEITNFLKN